MSDYLTTLLSVSAVSTLLSAILIWLTRTWISERLKGAISLEYNQKLETHKAQLKAAADIETERLKSQLQIAAAERSVRFERVFEETALTVAETYQRLLAFHDAVVHYTSAWEFANTPSKAERRLTVGQQQKEFLDYFLPRRLYLPKATAKKLKDFCDQLNSAAVDFMSNVEQGRDEILRRNDPDRDTWVKVNKFMSDEVPPILALLEDDFRAILGTHQ